MSLFLLSLVLILQTPQSPTEYETFCAREKLSDSECALLQKGMEWRAAYKVCDEERTTLHQQLGTYVPQKAPENIPLQAPEAPKIEANFWPSPMTWIGIGLGVVGGLALGYTIWNT